MNETTLHAKDCFKLCIVLLYYVLYMTVAGSGAGIDIDAILRPLNKAHRVALKPLL